jgi:putative membrane protein
VAHKRRHNDYRDGSVLKGVAAGVVGGLVACWTMNEFQALWSKLSEGYERPHGAQSLQQGSPQHVASEILQERGQDEDPGNTTERVAELVAEEVLHRKLTKRERKLGGEITHYATGAASGAIYGAMTEVTPLATKGYGLPFGAAVWAVLDEGLVPALGLSKPATAYPLSVHLYALASHLVYGLTTELVRRQVRRLI